MRLGINGFEKTRKRGYIMFCNKCGKEVGEGARFCPKCGAQFQVVTMSGTKANKRKLTKYIMTIVSICIVVLVAISVLSSVFGPNLKKSDTGESGATASSDTTAPSEEIPISVTIDGIEYNCYASSMTAEVSYIQDASGAVVIPATIEAEGNTYQVTSIGNQAFHSKESLTSVKLPEGLTTIGEMAFFWCKNLKRIELPKGLTTIGEGAFQSCDSLTNIEIPESVVFIGKRAFEGCRSLKSIKIPHGVTSIEKETFFGCDKLVSVELPEGLVSIGEIAFCACESLERVNFPEGLATIETHAFERCYYLLITELPSSLVTIEEEALWDCDIAPGGLVLPEGLITIGEQALPITGYNRPIKVPRTLLINNPDIKEVLQDYSVEVIEDVTEVEGSNIDYYYLSDFKGEDEYDSYLSYEDLSGLK